MSVPRTDRGVPSSVRGVPPFPCRSNFDNRNQKTGTIGEDLCVFQPARHAKVPRAEAANVPRGAGSPERQANP